MESTGNTLLARCCSYRKWQIPGTVLTLFAVPLPPCFGHQMNAKEKWLQPPRCPRIVFSTSKSSGLMRVEEMEPGEELCSSETSSCQVPKATYWRISNCLQFLLLCSPATAPSSGRRSTHPLLIAAPLP